VDGLPGTEMRASEKIKFHINNAKKDMFHNSFLESLVDAMTKFARYTLLPTTWLKEEISKFSSSAETEKVKKEHEVAKKEINETRGSVNLVLKVNEDLTTKLKIVVDTHS